MGELTDYRKSLAEAIDARKMWLEKSELVQLKEACRSFQSAFSSLYALYLKKGLINEDPYKHEVELGEIEIPSTESFSAAEKTEEISIRLSQYDTQLDYLVNFYQFSVDFLGSDQIQRILSLIKYIDWRHLSMDAASINTRAVTELTNQIRMGSDSFSSTIIINTTISLSKSTGSIIGYLKVISDFNREAYKLALRDGVTAALPEDETPSIAKIKKQFAASMPGKPFYTELVEELIQEDYSIDGPDLRKAVLKALQVPDSKSKAAKPVVSFKSILIDGILGMSSIAPTLNAIGVKFDENEEMLKNRTVGLWGKIKRLLEMLIHKEQESTVYELEYTDSIRGVPDKEKVNFTDLRSDMDKKAKTLASLSARGPKLQTMPEEQLASFLETSVREMQSLHKTLSALDEYFKAEISRDTKNKARGIKPELATMKNTFIRANQKRHEYSAQKEEEEQFKRLGISPVS
ncbi:MAG: hypothetical protein LBT14_11215 [Treponema sp.]|jgi:hypothetical protein|nr:hypothetical protein [Treponema sp.]